MLPEMTEPAPKSLRPQGSTMDVCALLIGDRIDVRTLGGRLAGAPLVTPILGSGWAVVFRYGAVVFFDASDEARQEFLQSLADRVQGRFERPETERALVHVDDKREEGVSEHALVIKEASLERAQIIAEILAKSVILARNELAMTGVFTALEPMASELQKTGRGFNKARHLTQHIGQVLLMQQNMVGRVEVTEKPELLWERPDLERLYLRLEDEYELRERHLALERKLDLISSTATTLLELLQARRSLRVEWYIVILIIVDILLGLYDKFTGA